MENGKTQQDSFDYANRILTRLTVYFSTVFIVRLTYRFQRIQLDNLFLKQYPFRVVRTRSVSNRF